VYAPVTDLALPGSAMTRYLRQIAADTTLLRSRSWLERISRPVLMLHGLDDRTVPPEHSARLRDILDSRHVPHACLTFAGERHVFRTADAIARALDAELTFYGQVFKFQPPAFRPLPAARHQRRALRAAVTHRRSAGPRP